MTQEESSRGKLAYKIERAVTDLNNVFEAGKILSGQPFFNEEKFINGGFKQFIDDTCKKYGVPPAYICKIAEIDYDNPTQRVIK